MKLYAVIQPQADRKMQSAHGEIANAERGWELARERGAACGWVPQLWEYDGNPRRPQVGWWNGTRLR